MKRQNIKDRNKRFLYKVSEVSHINFKILSRVSDKNFLFRIEKKRKNSCLFKTIVKNRCIISSRKSCIHKHFRVSRIILRISASNCLIVGLKKVTF